ncbi:DinB family protein [Paenibacillus sp. SI8]|uniref:DinB family protein n=1 Tax=unclassified Paenibacillus TaxID=185978 RepID=UPI003465AB0A
MSQSIIDLQKFTILYEQLRQAVEGLTEEQAKWKESETKWSVVEVLSHLVDHSIITSFRIRKIVAEASDSVVVNLPAFDQDPWVSSSRANESSLEEVFSVYQALLLYNTAFFKRISADNWEKSGVFENGKIYKLSELYDGFVNHVQRHLGQIDRIKQAL